MKEGSVSANSGNRAEGGSSGGSATEQPREDKRATAAPAPAVNKDETSPAETRRIPATSVEGDDTTGTIVEEPTPAPDPAGNDRAPVTATPDRNDDDSPVTTEPPISARQPSDYGNQVRSLAEPALDAPSSSEPEPEPVPGQPDRDGDTETPTGEPDPKEHKTGSSDN